jgi:predicted AlkP superfamily phosphohydrolase/phosphomutase
VYGKADLSQLIRLRNSLQTAPRRGADVVEVLLKREPFDLVWISLSAAHLGGHKFFDLSQLAEQVDITRCRELATPLQDIYRAVDEALGRILAALPAGTDILIVSPSGMGPNTSRSHVLPGMLQAVMNGKQVSPKAGHSSAGDSMWRIRSFLPTGLRAAIAGMMPDRWALELAARLELRNVNWADTQAFMMPNDDHGYIRLNLQGRERDGVVDQKDVDLLLDRMANGLLAFQNADGTPAVQAVLRVSDLGFGGPCFGELPDLIVQWSDQRVSPVAGVSSHEYGAVASPGWGTGRTGCHNGEAWALILPRTSKLKPLTKPPHIVDIAATICAVLGADPQGLSGQPLLQSPHTASLNR